MPYECEPQQPVIPSVMPEFLQAALAELKAQLQTQMQESFRREVMEILWARQGVDKPKPSTSKEPQPDVHADQPDPDLDAAVMEAPPWKICPVCRKGFSRTWQLDKHVYKAHSEIMKAYKCKFCGLYLCSHQTLHSHLEVHKLSCEHEHYECEECNAVYSTKSSLWHHSLTYQDPTLECETCREAGHAVYFHTKSEL